jgi:hypothetical protein
MQFYEFTDGFTFAQRINQPESRNGFTLVSSS